MSFWDQKASSGVAAYLSLWSLKWLRVLPLFSKLSPQSTEPPTPPPKNFLTVFWYPYTLLSGESYCGRKVSCPRSQSNDLNHHTIVLNKEYNTNITGQRGVMWGPSVGGEVRVAWGNSYALTNFFASIEMFKCSNFLATVNLFDCWQIIRCQCESWKTTLD